VRQNDRVRGSPILIDERAAASQGLHHRRFDPGREMTERFFRHYGGRSRKSK